MKTKKLFTTLFLFSLSTCILAQINIKPTSGHNKQSISSGTLSSLKTGETGNVDFNSRASCSAEIGTFHSTTNGTQVNDSTFILCYGDGLLVQSNNDFTPPDEIINPVTPPAPPIYLPQVIWAFYSCPPTVLTPGPNMDLNDDPCYIGFFPGDLNSLNNSFSIFQAFPSGTFTNNTIYFVPITAYGIDPLDSNMYFYSFVKNTTTPCYDHGKVYSVQYLPKITKTITPDCHTGTVSVTVSGGSPKINGTNFTASNLSPSSASLSTTTIGEGGTIVISGLNDGESFSFDIEDDNGCTTSITGTFSGVTPSGFSYSNNKYCKDGTNPTPTITGQNGGTFSKITGPSGLNLNTSTGYINLSSSTPGTYTIQYSSPGSPCNSVSTQVITINPKPTVNAGLNKAICVGGSVTLNGQGANTYIWNQGVSDGVSFSPTGTKTYTVTGTNTVTGCSNTDQVTVTVNPLPTAVISGATDYCQGYSATLDAGAGYTEYTWSTGGNSQTINATNADNPITVTVKDNNGCEATSTPFTVAENTVILSFNTFDICQGESKMIHGITETTSNVYSKTFSSATGCDSISQVTLNVHSLPIVSAGTDQTICFGGSITLNGSGASTYTWDNGVSDGVSFQPNNTQTYTVSGADVNGCEQTATVHVTVNPVPIADAGSDIVICEGEDLNMSATGGGDYSWTGPNSFTSNIQNPIVNNVGTNASGTYSVTVTNSNNCSANATVNVAVHSNPTTSATFTPNNPICPGETLDLHASGSGSNNYSWIGPDGFTGTGKDPSVTSAGVNASGDYIVTVTNSNNCTTNDTVNVLIIDNTPPIFNGCIDDTTLYNNASSCDITVPDFTGDSQLEIVDNCGAILSNTITVSQSPNAGTILGIGTYTGWIYAEDDNSNIDSCSFQLSISDTIPPTFNSGCGMDTILIPNTSSCDIIVPDLTTSPQVNITDNCGDIISGTITVTQSPAPGTILSSGTYTGWFYAEDNHSNIDSCTFIITVGGDTIAPTFNGCMNDTIIYSDVNSCGIDVSDFTGNPQIQVTDNCNDILLGTITMSQNPIAGTPLDVGVHEIWIIATDQSSNSDSCSFFLTVNDTIPPNIDIQLSSSSFCEGEGVTWTEGITDNCQVDSIFSTHQNGEVFPIGTTNVTYTVQDVNGNVTIDSFDVVVNSLPNLPELTEQAYSSCFGTPVTLSVNNPDNDYIYTWIFGGNNVGNGTTYEINSPNMGDNGTYTVVAESAAGCKSDIAVNLTIENCGVTISGAISPNNDGKNDKFVIDGIEAFPNTEVWIYNRWGTKVYHSDDYKNDWGGTSESNLNIGGNELPEGTYYYVIELGGVEGQPNAGKEYTGYVYLKR